MNILNKGLAVLASSLALAGLAHAQEGQLYAPGPFSRLVVAGVARIELTQGDRDQVFVVGDHNAQRNVELRWSTGQMRIDTGDDWKFWSHEPVQLKVQMRELAQLSISGASDIQAKQPVKATTLRVDISGQGSVRMSDLTAQVLRFNISGAGDGEAAGRVDELQLHVSGKGKFAAEKMRTTRTSVTISGIGNADLWATDELRITVSGIGTINYWGQPHLQRTSSGLANITAKGAPRP